MLSGLAVIPRSSVQMAFLALVCLAAPASTHGQFLRDEPSSLSRLEGGGYVDENKVRTAREVASHSITLPEWTNRPGFERDTFTFARVIFASNPAMEEGFGFGRRLGWWVDFPDADLNLSYRLRQMTSIAVDPDGRVLKLTNPDLPDYPLLFLEHVEGMQLSATEQEILRNYLLAGGAMFITDFWGTAAWDHFRAQMKLVVPEHDWVELETTHPLFQAIFPLRVPMHQLRVPTMQFWNPNSDPNDPRSRLMNRNRGEGSDTMHVWALLDDKQRIMAVAVHNSDISDGWERESENEQFFQQFSESRAYPLAINLIFYLMTH